MDVLVTGAAGRIGSRVTEQLLAQGHRVRALTMPGDPAAARLATGGADVVSGDLLDMTCLGAAVADVDAVCHIAAALTLHGAADAAFVDVNLLGTFNLLDAVRRNASDIRRFIYVSSDAVYWRGVGEAAYLPVDEAHPLLAGSIYGATKVGAEQLCRAFHASYGIPCTIMRPTATAEPAELIDPAGAFGRRWFLQSALRYYQGKTTPTPQEESLLAALRQIDDGTEKVYLLVAPDGTPALSMLTASRDAAAALVSMIEPPEAVGEAFNIGPAAPHSERLLLEHLGHRLGLQVAEIRHPAARPSWYVSSAKARSVLGYQPSVNAFEMIDQATGDRTA